MALGAVITLAGVNGIFAIFTDRATTGTNSAASRAEAASADIQIAAASLDTTTGASTCGTYFEDLATGVIEVTDIAPFVDLAQASVCIKNVGSRTVDLSTAVIELLDVDTACTGDEDALDATCGDSQEGELSGSLVVAVYAGDCSTFGTEAGTPITIDAMQATPIALPSAASGAVTCVYFEVMDQATGDAVTTTQSDQASWKFAFDATAT
jgi:hypothetical protein